MVLKVLIFTLLFNRAWQAPPGPQSPPTKGEVWPLPQHEKKEQSLYKFQKAKFEFQVFNNTCKTLADAIDRVQVELYKMHNTAVDISRRFGRYLRPKGGYTAAILHRLEIELSGPCEEYPYLGMEESYNLKVSTVSKLASPSLWGTLRGLETFLQLFYISDDYRSLLVNGTLIYDYPRYPHRGLLLDTARHYLPTGTIKTALDAMAMNKLNVFHWHIVDDQSFPYQSEKYPAMSEEGAYHPTMVYTKSDILDIVNYARDRGIRVIPEMDVPGHTRSWGKAYPEVLTECFVIDKEVAQGPLNPSSDFTYKLVVDLLQEVQQRFPDEYFHLGGDEIDTECWGTCPYLSAFMEVQNITLPQQLISVFFSRLIPLLGNRSQHIMWQEVFDEGADLPNGTLIQIWKSNWVERMNSATSLKLEWREKEKELSFIAMVKVLSHKMRVIFSTEWYLDHKDADWERMYLIDPRSLVDDVRQLNNVVGGEACMWGEHVDSSNIMSRVWPTASAVAERLWSNAVLDDAIKHFNQNPSDQPPSSEEPALDHPRSTSDPVHQPRVTLIGDEVLDINKYISLEDINIKPMSQKSSTFKPVSQTTSKFKPVSQTNGTFKPVSQTSRTFKPVSQTSGTFKPVPQTRKFEPVFYTSSTFKPVSQTSSTFKPVSQTSSTSKPVSQTRKLMATTHKVDLNLFEKANLIMEQLLLQNDLKSVRSRLEEHACRMLRRGVPAQPPNGPGFCVV